MMLAFPNVVNDDLGRHRGRGPYFLERKRRKAGRGVHVPSDEGMGLPGKWCRSAGFLVPSGSSSSTLL